MILVDTSVWIDHLRQTDSYLTSLLNAARVRMHPFVIGELMLGGLRRSSPVLAALRVLPCANIATTEEMPHFIDSNRLASTGIGYTEAHLLAGVALTPGCSIWTRNQRLLAVAARLGLAHATH